MAGRHFEDGPENEEEEEENEENCCWKGFEDGQGAKKNGVVKGWTT